MTRSNTVWETLILLWGACQYNKGKKFFLYNLRYTVAVSQFHAGFIQPAFVDKMLHNDDPAGFADRQLFDFPPERDVYLKDLKLPLPPDTPSIESLLRVCINLLCLVVNCYTNFVLPSDINEKYSIIIILCV